MSNRISKLAYHLLGSCMSLDAACTDLGFNKDDLSFEELNDLDNQVVMCGNCGWWVSPYEFDGEFCFDCIPEEND